MMKQTNIFKSLLCIGLMAAATTATAQHKEVILRDGWRFSRAEGLDSLAPAQEGYNDKKWQTVQVPHDWAIGGPFDKEIDKQTVAIEQNGEKEATEKTGRSGSLPWIGEGWYRTTFTVEKDCPHAYLNFDGAMSEPVVYVNGKKAGEWKYGYTPFDVDITPYIYKDGRPNTLAVHLQNVEESSRWYPGAGLFRPVTLVQTGATYIAPWGIDIRTTHVHGHFLPKRMTEDGHVYYDIRAEIKVGCSGDGIIEEKESEKRKVTMSFNGKTYDIPRNGSEASCTLELQDVELWSPEKPKLYDITFTITDEKNNICDSKTIKYGFRTIEYGDHYLYFVFNDEPDYSLKINGRPYKLKGVCLHHDLGMIGAAVNRAALERQLLLLKSMGCNAIRTSHNMPSQWQMDLCDSLGIMVMAESFDMWKYPKCKNGYARFYDEWWYFDLRNLLRSNMLHPSIVMWSIGNEIPEQGMKNGNRMTREMQELLHLGDPTRPVTAGCDRMESAINTGFAQVLDIPGMNYRTHIYEKCYDRLRQGFVLGSETASTVSSRGVYKFPVERRDGKAYADGQCSSYDVEACWWSNIPEDDWLLQDDRNWVIGEFVWTGFDYLGEPTPYDEYWPSRSSYFGIFDLAGLPKDRYYLYRSRWNTEDKTIHLLPHWTWPGREGEATPVYCYTNYPTAELFVNGKSQGKITKNTDAKKPSGKDGRITDIGDPVIDRYRLRWNNVKYEPGEIKVVVYDKDGQEVGTETVRTAGAPTSIQLTGDLGAAIKPLKADGEDMTFITVNILDKDGNLAPDADNQLTVSVTGAARFKGICNGDATSLEAFTKPTMKAFHGQLVIGIQSNSQQGTATVKVTGKGLKAATVTVPAK